MGEYLGAGVRDMREVRGVTQLNEPLHETVTVTPADADTPTL